MTIFTYIYLTIRKAYIGNANCFYVQTKKCTVKEISSTNRHSFSFTIYIAYIDTNGNTKITVKEFLITNRYERIVKGI